ncbi:MCP four helix bundle domain-containing protein, partial [Magnetospirillum sp. UT-4]|uniref:MCP four helix bundle domain-containing protein n=1 Tax=Magnetospirillum sp. UT-4 TaxID=2681467 RepID=UPI0015734171
MFRNLTIARKLAGSFALLAVIVIALALVSIDRLATVNATASAMATRSLPATRMLGQIDAGFADYRRLLAGHILFADEAAMGRYERDIAGLNDRLDKIFIAYEPLIASGEERRMFAAVTDGLKRYRGEGDRVMELSRPGRKDEALAYTTGPAAKIYAEARKALDEMLEHSLAAARTAAEQGDAVYSASRWGLIAAGMVATLLTTLFAVSLRAAIS